MEKKSIKILLVEDDAIDQMAFERFVKKEALHFDYIAAESVQMARKIMASQTFDVVVSDYMLGDGTLLDLFPDFKDTPVIVVTGTGDEKTAVKAMKQGAADYLIKDPEGNYLKILPATVENALDRKNAQEELKKYRENLEELVRERTAELETEITERKRLEEERIALVGKLQQAQKMEAIGTLAGGIAHDFNNILFSIFGYTELALGEAKKRSLQHENLQQVLIAGNRAKDLVQQILTFSRQADQEQKPVQVKLIVKEALKLLRASIPTTIEIEQNVRSNALIMGDSTQIHQVLMNLCTNAAHAMEDKGGVLTVNLSDAELDSEFISNHPDLKPGQYINLTVADTGQGMPPAVLEKIFDPFFTTKEKGEGTGMGLSVVHGIVHSHGGTVYVYSEPGKGSTFKVFFPAIEKRLEPEDRVEKPIATGTESVLFIDDEPAIVNMGKQILETLGYDVVTRTSSIEALEYFKAQPNKVDLVITDMTMPKMTGEVLANELLRVRPDIPVILCTGFSFRMDEKKAKDMGIRALISKPILKREIAETIRAVLDNKL